MGLTDEFIKATVEMRENGTQPARLLSEASSETGQDDKGRIWRWQVEPGMEDALQDLLGWLLSGQRDAEIETAVVPAASPPLQSRPRRACPAGCCAWAT
jgi:hypothetical protein